ncbi:MAG: flagellar basal body L-ring protein FlgH [Deltaproteobacteria bacterium]|nr:flagellar basal body L-ring protein FlgH [Deltaproteobacteria bacterium]
MTGSRRLLALIALAFLLPSCGWMQSLRREIDDDGERKINALSDMDYYKDPANRYAPPPPANAAVAEAQAQIAGTPVDLSGQRAKRIRVTAAEFMAENTKNENSLWAEDGQTNYLFARNKLKAPGDLVTVQIEDGLRKDMVNTVKNLLPPEYRDQDIRVPGLTKDKPADRGLASAPAATPPADGTTPSTDLAAEDMLTAEVLERYPNGNVRVRGIKRVPFKRQVRNIEVVAIVKGADIGEQDVVKSSKFFDQHVEIYR